MRIWTKCGVFAALVAATLCAMAASNRRAPVPGPDGESVVWQAEAARQVGAWQRTERADADGGAYVRPEGWRADGERALEFEFDVPKRTVLSVYPNWWRHGERRPAVRFPDPLPRSVGPSAVATVGDAVFFAAPATGRVGVRRSRAHGGLSIHNLRTPRLVFGDVTPVSRCGTRWQLRRLVRLVNRTLNDLKVEKHPDKTSVGRIARGFDFLGHHLTPTSIAPSEQALTTHLERRAQLYEQGAGPRRLG